VGRVRLARSAPRFDGQALPAPKPAPHLGEHGIAILREIGWSEAQIADLQQAGVLKT
jgi:crotonobetainyl-CoA:carnitine CoA-transferase CaiB-like acyl-CoA transferase